MKYDNYFYVVDVETGGLPSQLKKKAVDEVAITELAFVVVSNEDLQIVDEKNWIFKPYKDDLIYQEEAAMVSGLDRDFCEQNGQHMEEAFYDIIQFVKKYKKRNKKHYLVGHNINRFDLDFVVNLWGLNRADVMQFFLPDVIDTLHYSRLKFVESNNFKLATCCKLSNIVIDDAHRAKNDAIATAKLWIDILNSLRGSGGKSNVIELKRFRDNFQL